MAPVLSVELRKLSKLLRHYADQQIELPPPNCLRVSLLLGRCAQQADALESRSGEAEELEDELYAVASDLLAATASPSYQAALREQQREIQRELDRGGPGHVSRPGLAALSAPFGDGNVVSFPKAPRS
jgi:hypothetical protein